MTFKLDLTRSFPNIKADCFVLTKKYIRPEIHNWCAENEIISDFIGTVDKADIWFIKDDSQRVLFALRWHDLAV